MTDLTPYRDALTGAVALVPNTEGKSCDNHLLFTATAEVLGYLPIPRSFLFTVLPFGVYPGVFTRYPGEAGASSWDDHMALAVASPALAADILAYGEAHGWTWTGLDGKSNWLGRMPLFKPTVRAAAGKSLGPLDKLLASLCFLTNTREIPGETSGVCLLYLAQHVLEGQGWLLDWSIRYWRRKSMAKYPEGIRGAYKIYYKPDHPFAKDAPLDFDPVS